MTPIDDSDETIAFEFVIHPITIEFLRVHGVNLRIFVHVQFIVHSIELFCERFALGKAFDLERAEL